jgi:hypothetical protein
LFKRIKLHLLIVANKAKKPINLGNNKLTLHGDKGRETPTFYGEKGVFILDFLFGLGAVSHCSVQTKNESFGE